VIRSFSIRAKLLIVVVVTTCASLFLTAVGLGIFEYFNHRRTMLAEMATVSEIIGANSTAALSFNDEAAARETLSALEPQREIRQACLYDQHGRLFASFVRRGEHRECPASAGPDGARFEGGLFLQSRPVMLEADRIGSLGLVATQDNLWRNMQLFGLVLALTTVASLGTGLLVSFRLRRVISLPILELAQTAQRVSENRDYALRAPQRGQDEIGVAVRAFNHMLDRIQDADSALRQAEQKSRQQAQFLGSILDTMGEGMIVIDQAAKILVWNAAATRITGSGPVDVPLSEWPQHLKIGGSQPQVSSAEELPLARALRGEIVAEQELHLQASAERGDRWVDSSARPLRDEHGTITGAIAVFRDVTPQKEAERNLKASEAQLRQAQKMEAVGQLAGGIAHDFNNLLTVICGFSDFALQSLPEDAPGRADIEEVMNAGQRAATLTRQLLAFSRRQVLAPQELDLNAVVNASCQMLRRLIGENVEFSAIYRAKRGAVRADPGQIDQVILNLVVNARDAMPSGGKLTIETDDVVLDEQQAGGHVGARAGGYARLQVRDTGVGMSPEVQARIFEPFFTTKGVGHGTGLGLSMVYGIVQQSGGFIEVTSTPGAGTTFSVYLPWIEDARTPAGRDATATLPVPRGTETILLVEDEASIRNFAVRILSGLGYKVLVASDGQAAIELQAEYDGPIHLLISDVVMPRLSGGELARRLSQRLPGLPVVFFSGYAPDVSLTSTFTAEGLTLIPKPFTAEVLGRAVREALSRARSG
jgi:two-component system, cell cycle sensor histidine kinase and response regulator CckA